VERAAKEEREDTTAASAVATAVKEAREEKDRRVDITLHLHLSQKKPVKLSVKITFYHHHPATHPLIATVLSWVSAVLHQYHRPLNQHRLLNLVLLPHLLHLPVIPIRIATD